MVVTREDKFGCIGDVCGAAEGLRVSQIPTNCVNAIREGARDFHRNGASAWGKNDRFLYLGLVAALVAVVCAAVRRVARRRRTLAHPLQPLPSPQPPPSPPRVDRIPSSIMDEYMLVPKHLATR